MGGKGSNRWRNYQKNLCVEDCGILRIEDFMPLNVEMKSGSLQLIGAQGIDKPLLIEFFFRSKGYIQPNLKIDIYSRIRRNLLFSQCLHIVKTEYPKKGARFWFCCTGVKYENPCGRRVRRLYLYPEEQFFKCRHCCELTYKSSQTPDGLKRKLRRTAESLGIDILNL